MIDITGKGALYFDALREKTSRTRYEEAEHEILQATWDEREIGGPFPEEDLDIWGTTRILTGRHPSWGTKATRSLVEQTIRSLKELDYIEEV